jgi:hypothetical protein
MQENRIKVQEKINELNQSSPGWVDVAGFHAITSFEFPVYGKGATFNPSAGFPVKIFVNNITGEVKLFAAALFKSTI